MRGMQLRTYIRHPIYLQVDSAVVVLGLLHAAETMLGGTSWCGEIPHGLESLRFHFCVEGVRKYLERRNADILFTRASRPVYSMW